MSKNSGKIVQWKAINGNICVGIARNEDQTSEIQKSRRVMIRFSDEHGDLLKDESGKNVITLKHPSLLTVIGFID